MFTHPLYRFALLFLVTCCTLGCNAFRQTGDTSLTLHTARQSPPPIVVAQALSYAGSGKMWAQVPTDALLPPRASFAYSLFAEEADGAITRHAHIIESDLNRQQWQWEMETWALPEALSYAKFHTVGKDWTIQILPVTSKSDWFSMVWKHNGKDVPEFWLAKRWSTTSPTQIRTIAEYREAAPVCMRDALQAAAQQPQGVRPLHGKTLWQGCDNEVREFSARADVAITLQTGGAGNTASSTLAVPANSKPNMGKLVGRAERKSNGDGIYRD